MGRTDSGSPVNILSDGSPDGCMADSRCFGSYIHGILDNPAVVEYILRPYLGPGACREIDWGEYKERQYDLLADWLREYIDIPRLYKIMACDD